MCAWCMACLCWVIAARTNAQGTLTTGERTGAWQLRVTVLDSLEGDPIEGVELSWKDGTVPRLDHTDRYGRCTIGGMSAGGGTIEVHFSIVGHRARSVTFPLPREGATRSEVVRLSSLELPAVELVRPAPELIFQRPDLHAADLLINDQGIWVLAYERPRMLRAEAEQGREILRDVRLLLLDTLKRERASVPVGEDVLGLRRDLRDAVVIEGSANAFAVARSADGLVLTPFGLDDLRRKVLPWTDSIPGRVLGSNGDQVKPAFDHIAYDPPRDSAELICTVVDSFMLQLFRSEYRFLRGPEKVVAMNLAQELGVDKEIVAGYMSGFQHNIWFKPLYAPLFVSGDTLLVFDHGAGMLRKFTRGFHEHGRVPLPYLGRVDGRDWAGRVLQDRATERLYAVFARNGQQWLRPIDPVTGRLGERKRITHRYPERLQVHGGAVYYVYRPVESLQKRSIYRERL